MLNLPVGYDDIVAASDRIEDHIVETPLFCAGPGLYLKQEQLQVTRSFKPRGACNAMLQLSKRDRDIGVISRSSGNFAQALSYIGQRLGVDVTIVMPEHAPTVKVENTRSFGARVILKGHQHRESQAVVDRLSESEGLVKMHPYDDPHVIAGQGTAMLEVLDVVDTVDVFFCPVSGGGLLSGASVALKHRFPAATIVAVEPEGASDYFDSRASGNPVVLDHAESVADGLMAPSVGGYCRPILDALVDRVQLVSDDAILAAMHGLHAQGVMAEPSGAASVAAYLASPYANDGVDRTVVCMISGGNYDPGTLPGT